MRILLSSGHRYPANKGIGCGIQPTDDPSGSIDHVHDLLAKGLSESSHHVFYLMEQGAGAPLPPGVTLVSKSTGDVDVFHNMESHCKPWVGTWHGFL